MCSSVRGPGPVPVPGPRPHRRAGLPLARWSATEGVPPERAPIVVVIFASRTGIFTALLSSEDVDALPPVTTLLDVARRQIERAGGSRPRHRQHRLG